MTHLENILLEACQRGYLQLLQLPADSIQRVQAQSDLCTLRDAIAMTTGESPEETQLKYEREARRLCSTGQ